jgi:hypothetical protein
MSSVRTSSTVRIGEIVWVSGFAAAAIKPNPLGMRIVDMSPRRRGCVLLPFAAWKIRFSGACLKEMSLNPFPRHAVLLLELE